MQTIYAILLLLLFSSITVYAQPKHSFFLNAGYTYNSPIELNEQAVENSQGYLFSLGGVKKLVSYKEYSFELGFALKTIFTSGQIGDMKFNATTLRVAIPVGRDCRRKH